MEESIQKKYVNRNITIWAFVFLIAAIGIQFLAEYYLDSQHIIKNILLAFSSAFLTTGLLGLAWELTSKRSFSEELNTRFGIKNSVVESGLEDIQASLNGIQGYPDIIRKSGEITVVLAYSEKWLTSNNEALKYFLSNKRNKLKVYLTDLDNEDALRYISSRFRQDEDKMKERIRDTVDAFKNLQADDSKLGTLEVYGTTISLDYALYKFGANKIIINMYSKRSPNSVPSTPALAFDCDANFGNYLLDELGEIEKNSRLL